MTDRLKPVPFATHCRCGHGMPKGATARWDAKERLYYDCHLCRPRPDPREPDTNNRGMFQNHNCAGCDNGRLPCKQGHPHNCDNPRARND